MKGYYYGKMRIDKKKKIKNTKIQVENFRREKPWVEKNNPLCQKLVQNGRVSNDYYINP